MCKALIVPLSPCPLVALSWRRSSAKSDSKTSPSPTRTPRHPPWHREHAHGQHGFPGSRERVPLLWPFRPIGNQLFGVLINTGGLADSWPSELCLPGGICHNGRVGIDISTGTSPHSIRSKTRLHARGPKRVLVPDGNPIITLNGLTPMRSGVEQCDCSFIHSALPPAVESLPINGFLIWHSEREQCHGRVKLHVIRRAENVTQRDRSSTAKTVRVHRLSLGPSSGWPR